MAFFSALARIRASIAGPINGPATWRGVREAAARQLASRARRRVSGVELEATAEGLAQQRRVVDAFLAASREGDFEGLVSVLAPDVVFHSDRGTDLSPGRVAITGADDVAKVVLARGTPFAPFARPRSSTARPAPPS